MPNPLPLVVAFALGAALAGCGGGDEGVTREIATLRAKTEAQAGEAADVQRRVKDLEARSRSLEEQVASLALRPGPAAAAGKPGAARALVPGEESSPGTAAAADPAPADSSMPSFLDSEEGKQRLRDFLASEEKEKQQKNTQAMQDRMETAVRERVTGYWTEQLGLDKHQQDALVAITTDAARKGMELWRGAQDNRGDPASFTALREKGQQIRQDALDQIAQTLTQDQNAKFKELGGENPGAFLDMGRGMGGPGGGRGGGQPGGPPR